MTEALREVHQTGAPRQLLDSMVVCLKKYGFAGLSTRKVAEEAGMPLSQIHYHFGSKKKLVLALLARQTERLLGRQERMFRSDEPLWRRWEQACDYLQDDLESGYVRVLQEMIAAGWSDPDIAAEVRRLLGGWMDLLRQVVEQASPLFSDRGPLQPAEVTNLISALFLGVEAMILLGFEETGYLFNPALRKIGQIIRNAEEANSEKGD